MTNPIAFSESTNKDTMYGHQAMKQPDVTEFRKATINEFDNHCQNKHWEMIERSQVPMYKNILPVVWAMRRNGI